MNRIGVLALQGAFIEHMAMLRRLGTEALPVRRGTELAGLDGLVIPGGESTTIGKLMAEYEFRGRLQELMGRGFPVFGTCAGMILLAREVNGLEGQPLAALDIVVRRNAFGRQVDSFEAELTVAVLGEKPFPAVFIRAPLIESTGEGVEVLARLPSGTAVAIRQSNVLATAFHPELTTDARFHNYFLEIVDRRNEG